MTTTDEDMEYERTKREEHNRNAALVAQKANASLAKMGGYTDNEIGIIKSQIAKNCTDQELALFIQVCKKTGLDPFSKQIYAIKRRNKQQDGTWVEVMSIQTGIDGLRVLAQRGGKYRGQTLPLFCGADGVWKELWLASTPPVAAKVGVYVEGFPEPLYAIALLKTYQQNTSMWSKMPEVLLAKCAEAQAIRKACPNDTSQLYIAEEMEQADEQDNVWEGKEGRATSPALEALPPAREPEIYTETPAQKRQLQKILLDQGVTDKAQMVELSKISVGIPMENLARHIYHYIQQAAEFGSEDATGPV
jgi:phage recombination protein Bet